MENQTENAMEGDSDGFQGAFCGYFLTVRGLCYYDRRSHSSKGCPQIDLNIMLVFMLKRILLGTPKQGTLRI